MTKSTGPKYTGILAEPQRARRWSIYTTSEEVERDRTKAFLDRLVAIIDFYAIQRDDPHALTKLLLALLHAHVPGFNTAPPPRKRGAPRGWLRGRQFMLWAEVQQLNPKDGDLLVICDRIAKKHKHTGRYGTKVSKRSLYSRYMKIRKTKDEELATFMKVLGDLAREGDSWNVLMKNVEVFAEGLNERDPKRSARA